MANNTVLPSTDNQSTTGFDPRQLPRPRWGWLAWEATVGYIHRLHSPDATLKLEIYPQRHIIGWAASLTWGVNSEKVRDLTSFADALNSLWCLIDQHHDLLSTAEARARRPINYGNREWLDEPTYGAFSRLVNTTDTVFSGDWLIVITYRPAERADRRLQARLLADANRVHRGSYGATLREASRTLYLNSAPIYHQYRQQSNGKR